MPRRRGRPPYPDLLTPAEWDILDSIRHGMSRREIAGRHAISVDGVRYHVRNIAGKLGVAGAPQLRHWPGYPLSSPMHNTRSQRMPDSVSLGPIGQVSLFCRSVARTEAFYRDTLGFPHLFTFGDLTFFDAAGTRLFIRAVAEEEWRPSSILYFLVDDIRTAHEDLLALGVRFQDAPHLIYSDDATGVEEWMAFFEDSEGNTLAIMSRVTPAAGT